jgi:hypothetical protein
MWEWIKRALEWLGDAITDAIEQVVALLIDGLVAVIELIPVPDFMTQLPGAFSAIAGTVGYFLAPFQVPQGIAIIASAYAIRFIIRRLPFIG